MALLQAAGAAVRFYVQAGDELLHAKLGIFDRGTVLFGSCNWSYSGFTRNHELDLLVHDARLAWIFLSRMEQDWGASTPEVVTRQLGRRPQAHERQQGRRAGPQLAGLPPR